MPTSDEHSFFVAKEAVSDETAQMVSAATGGRIQACEVPAPMLSEDVPADLVTTACEAAYGTPLDPGDDRRQIARALAAVLPAYAAMVMRDVTVKQWGDTLEAIVHDSVNERLADLERDIRAKVAAELFERADWARPGTSFRRGVRAAARFVTEQDIARGEGQAITGLTCPTCGNAATDCTCLEGT